MHNSHAMFKWFKEQPGNMGIRTLSMKDSFTCAKFLLNKKYVYVQFVKVGGGGGGLIYKYALMFSLPK